MDRRARQPKIWLVHVCAPPSRDQGHGVRPRSLRRGGLDFSLPALMARTTLNSGRVLLFRSIQGHGYTHLRLFPCLPTTDASTHAEQWARGFSIYHFFWAPGGGYMRTFRAAQTWRSRLSASFEAPGGEKQKVPVECELHFDGERASGS